MADITVQISNATSAEERTGAFILNATNTKRLGRGLPALANLGELVSLEIETGLFPKWERMEADYRTENSNLLQRFKQADNDTRDQIIALLPELD